MTRCAALLVANRGEIARPHHPRLPRGRASRRVAVYSDADAGAPHVRAADRAVRIGPPPPRESYLNIAALIDAARATGADAVHPGLRLPVRERAAFARACAAAGHDLHRSAGRRDRADGIEDRRARADGAGRRAGRARATPRPTRSDAGIAGRGAAIGFPVAGQGLGRRRRQGDARRSRDAATPSRRSPAARREAHGGLRRRHALRRAADRAAAARRDPGLRRRPRQRRPPVRARVLGPAPPPEGHRGEPVARARRRPCAQRMGDGRGGRGARRRLPQRRHDRVPARRRRRRRAVLLPRDEHAAAGRAPGHRGGHRHRPRARAAARSRRARRCRGRRTRSRSAGTRSSAASTPRIRRTDSCRRPGRCCSIASRPGPGIRIDSGVVEGDRGAGHTTIRCSPS